MAGGSVAGKMWWGTSLSAALCRRRPGQGPQGHPPPQAGAGPRRSQHGRRGYLATIGPSSASHCSTRRIQPRRADIRPIDLVAPVPVPWLDPSSRRQRTAIWLGLAFRQKNSGARKTRGGRARRRRGRPAGLPLLAAPRAHRRAVSGGRFVEAGPTERPET
jgi:hypothetical protein